VVRSKLGISEKALWYRLHSAREKTRLETTEQLIAWVIGRELLPEAERILEEVMNEHRDEGA